MCEFKVNDVVVCGANGVCRIRDIGTVSGCGSRIYYTLMPAGSPHTTVYIPSDSDKIRKCLTAEEAEAVTAQINDIPCFENPRAATENDYRETLKKCDCTCLISMIKTIYFRKGIRKSLGKKMTSTDEKYLKIAENALTEELAAALNEPQELLQKLVRTEIKKSVYTLD